MFRFIRKIRGAPSPSSHAAFLGLPLGDADWFVRTRTPMRYAAIALLTMLAATAAAWWDASDVALHLARERFAFKVSETKQAIEQRLLAYENVLLGGAGLFAASTEVTRDDWQAYVGALQIERRYPGIQGVGFAQRVRPAEREHHVLALRAAGFPQYALWPAGEREDYTAIIYLEPFDWRNRRAFGYDMFSEPVRREAMLRARDGAQAAASGKVILVQETASDAQSGFLMYVPVYAGGSRPATVEQRRDALLGYVYAPFRMNDLLRGIVGNQEHPELRMEIYDGTELSPLNLLYESDPDAAEAAEEELFSDVSAIEFGGRRWTLRFASLPAFAATAELQKVRLILAAGVLISALFAAVVWALAVNRQRSRALAAAVGELQTEIAERTQLEAALERSRDAAEAANRAKSEFLANVSHELRTPLTLILAPLEQQLAAPTTTAESRIQLERAQRSAFLLLNRVNNILDFSKAEAGRFDHQPETFDLREMLPPLVEDARPVADGKHCSLTCEIRAGVETACVDRRHLETIVLNLLSNALKFTPPGGWVRVEVTPIDDAHFELAVADSGIGIAADKLPLLFTRFQQVESSATRQYGGTGIGLALVKELTDLMGGTVDVVSERDRGSRFFVRLPHSEERAATVRASQPEHDRLADALRRARFAEAMENAAPPDSPMPSASSRRPSLPQVLVADDNAEMRAYVAELLQAECDVLVAADGLQAWHLLQQHHVDVVVSDVMMPQLDGIGLVARIKTDAGLSHIPVILLTARGGHAASVAGLDSGADDYLAKPFSVPELKARVRATLRMARVQTQRRDKSHEAGVAATAIGILHNLGNALNGVTFACGRIEEQLQCSKTPSLRKLADLLESHSDDLSGFMTRDQRGQVLPQFLDQLSRRLDDEQHTLRMYCASLRSSVDHALGIIAAQRRFTGHDTPVVEPIRVPELMDLALKLSAPAFDGRDIGIERDYLYSGSIVVDRHRVLQILLNLLANACDAVRDVPHDRRVTLRTSRSAEAVRLEIGDNGVGIAHEHGPLMFDQGFTTKPGAGHGFGLHSSANFALELGGSLSFHSAGPGRGARFTLELPIRSRTCVSDSEPSGEINVEHA